MCQKCGKSNGCSNCKKSSSADTASIQNELLEVRSLLDEVISNTKFLSCGHPIMMLDNSDDIASFDQSSGLGSNCWAGWVVCNGVEQTIPGTTKKFTPANLIDRFVVGAGDQYDVGDTGGEDKHILDLNEIPSHNHTLTDSGHNHPINDDGHVHGASSGPHTHTFTGDPHTHAVGPDGSHSHELNPAVFSVNGNGGTGPFGAGVGALVTGTNYGGLTTNNDGAHSHAVGDTTATGSLSSDSVGVVIANAATGIEVLDALTGISIASEGGGLEHENRPPYYAVLFVQKL